MHELVYVFIDPKREVQEAVDEALAPFSEELPCPQRKIYVTEHFKSEMRRTYGDLTDRQLAEKMVEWQGEPGFVDERGLFFATTRNPHGKWDWYAIGGRWEGVKPSPDDAPYAFVTPGRIWEAREWWNWDEANSIGRLEKVDLQTWKREWNQAMEEYGKTCVIVAVDCHH